MTPSKSRPNVCDNLAASPLHSYWQAQASPEFGWTPFVSEKITSCGHPISGAEGQLDGTSRALQLAVSPERQSKQSSGWCSWTKVCMLRMGKFVKARRGKAHSERRSPQAKRALERQDTCTSALSTVQSAFSSLPSDCMNAEMKAQEHAQMMILQQVPCVVGKTTRESSCVTPIACQSTEGGEHQQPSNERSCGPQAAVSITSPVVQGVPCTAAPSPVLCRSFAWDRVQAPTGGMSPDWHLMAAAKVSEEPQCKEQADGPRTRSQDAMIEEIGLQQRIATEVLEMLKETGKPGGLADLPDKSGRLAEVQRIRRTLEEQRILALPPPDFQSVASMLAPTVQQPLEEPPAFGALPVANVNGSKAVKARHARHQRPSLAELPTQEPGPKAHEQCQSPKQPLQPSPEQWHLPEEDTLIVADTPAAAPTAQAGTIAVRPRRRGTLPSKLQQTSQLAVDPAPSDGGAAPAPRTDEVLQSSLPPLWLGNEPPFGASGLTQSNDPASLLRQCEALEALTNSSRSTHTSSGRGSLARTESMMSQAAASSTMASTRAPESRSWSFSSTGSITPSFVEQLNEHNFPGKPAPPLTSEFGTEVTGAPSMRKETQSQRAEGLSIRTDLGSDERRPRKSARAATGSSAAMKPRARPRPSSSRRSSAGSRSGHSKAEHADQTQRAQRSHSCTLPSTWIEGAAQQDTSMQTYTPSTSTADKGLTTGVVENCTHSAEIAAVDASAPRLVRTGRRRSSSQRTRREHSVQE